MCCFKEQGLAQLFIAQPSVLEVSSSILKLAQTDRTTPNNVGTCNVSWEGYNPYDLVNSKETMCNERAWPEQRCQNCANGSNIVALRFGDHGTKEMLGVVGLKV